MAISYAHPMFLLTLSLFFLPILQSAYDYDPYDYDAYDYDFTDCGLAKSYPVKVTGVQLIRDDWGRLNLNVNGYTRREITEAYMYYKVTRGTKIVDKFQCPVCMYFLTCPVASGSNFVLRFGVMTDFASVKVKITMQNDQKEEIMCVFFNLY